MPNDAEKPDIPTDIVAKWQRIVDLLAAVMVVPAGLVMRAEPPNHMVFVSSKSAENPYDTDMAFTLHTGLYCDAVMDSRCELLVRNAAVEPEWRNNPDMKHAMTFYIGYPLAWPDGQIFGTICVLDTRENPNAINYRALLSEFSHVIDGDLALLIEMSERTRLAIALQESRDELEIRVESRTRELAEVNTTLRVLLNRVEQSRAEQEEQIVRNINELVTPLIGKLKNHARTPELQTSLALLEASLQKIASSLSNRLSARFAGLTPTEIEIAMLVMQGLNTKQIAKSIARATSTVDFHRNNIRKKLGLEGRTANLRSFLSSLH